MSFAAIAAALIGVAALASVPIGTYASELVVTYERPDSVNLRVADGKLSGTFRNRPLVEVLEAIKSQAGFEYQAGKAALDLPVSGEFEGAPLIEAMKRILEPFNYVIISQTLRDRGRVHIVSVRGPAAMSGGDSAGVPLDTSNPVGADTHELELPMNVGPMVEDHLADLSSEERVLFEMANQKLGPPAELLDYFEPVPVELDPSVSELFDVADQELGPPPELNDYFEPAFMALEPNVSDLFEVAGEKLGPPPELLEYFEPVPDVESEETGPSAPDLRGTNDPPFFEAPY